MLTVRHITSAERGRVLAQKGTRFYKADGELLCVAAMDIVVGDNATPLHFVGWLPGEEPKVGDPIPDPIKHLWEPVSC